MALALARILARDGRIDSGRVMAAYRQCLDSEQFDCGNTIADGLQSTPNPDSMANGALMRVSPLGFFGTRQDAELTHPNPIFLQVNALFSTGIAGAIRDEITVSELYERIATDAEETGTVPSVRRVIESARTGSPGDYCHCTYCLKRRRGIHSLPGCTLAPVLRAAPFSLLQL